VILRDELRGAAADVNEPPGAGGGDDEPPGVGGGFMIPDVLHIGPIPIHLFGIFLALAFLAAGSVTGREFTRRGWDANLASSAVVWAAVGGLLGARVWIVLDAWSDFLRDPVSLLFTGGGFVFYGGLLGGTVAVTLFFRRHAIPWLAGADAVAPAIVLGQAIRRLRCP